MKNFPLICVLLCVTACSKVYYKPVSDLEHDMIRGRVKKLVQYNSNIYRLDEKKGAVAVSDSTVILYNTDGNVLELRKYAPGENRPFTTEIYTYDSNGLLLNGKVYNMVYGNEMLSEETIYAYDGHGLLSEEVVKAGKYVNTIVYIRDERGFPERLLHADGEGAAQKNVYDKKGRLISETTGSGENARTRSYKYGAGKKVKVITQFDGTIDIFDRKGNLRKSSYTVTDKDPETDSVTSVYYIDVHARYKFDAHGNWIYNEMRYDDEIISETVRYFEYF